MPGLSGANELASKLPRAVLFLFFVFSFILFWSVAPCETGLFLPIRLRCDMLFFGIGSIHYDGIGGKTCGEQMEQPKFTPECCAVVYWSIFCFAF